MTDPDRSQLEIGYDIPARPGMAESEIQTPCLLLDLDAFESNLDAMRDLCRTAGVRLRAHGKMHKSADAARAQIERGAVGICCQKVSEAEAFIREGIDDVLVSNQVRSPRMIDRLAALARQGARVGVCVDDPANVGELATAAARHSTRLHVLVEVDCGARRCGVSTPREAVGLAERILSEPALRFSGFQAYNGAMQHLATHAERAAETRKVLDIVRATIDEFAARGIACETVTGGGTGCCDIEAAAGLYTEIQCGSYAFMDADYGRLLDADGRRLDESTWKNALFVLASVMSRARPGLAVCDAGLKSLTLDSGLPMVFGRGGVRYCAANDEHGLVEDASGVLHVNDKLRLVPGHCDPTCNLHDWYVCVRAGRVESLWPVTARGKSF